MHYFSFHFERFFSYYMLFMTGLRHSYNQLQKSGRTDLLCLFFRLKRITGDDSASGSLRQDQD